jgi:2OG-Fe(II) oxygenase superfamily
MDIDHFLATHSSDDFELQKILKDVYVVPNLLSSDECNTLIESFENADSIERLRTRNRIMFESEKLAEWLWDRIENFYEHNQITDEYGDTWEAYGLNDRFRMVRYDPNDEFSIHEDGWYTKDYNNRSFATAMVYLNDVPEEKGGSTTFTDHSIKLQPAQGLGFVFLVDGIIHKGDPLTSGVKYILRTDVMYEATHLKNPDLKKEIHELYQELDDIPENELNTPESLKRWTIYFDLLKQYE